MIEYTPDANAVRWTYMKERTRDYRGTDEQQAQQKARDEFDRWLQQVKTEAIQDAADMLSNYVKEFGSNV